MPELRLTDDERRLTLSQEEAVRFLAALDRIDEDSVARLRDLRRHA